MERRGQRKRRAAPSFTLLDEQRPVTGHRLILINRDMWHSGANGKLTLGAINLVLIPSTIDVTIMNLCLLKGSSCMLEE